MDIPLHEHPNKTGLKSFSIKGLFGSKDVTIPFDNESLVLIAENGSGKTTILNTLYYLLSLKLSKFESIDFDIIHLEFSSGDSIKIKKEDLVLKNTKKYEELISELSKILPINAIHKLNYKLARLNEFEESRIVDKELYMIFRKYREYLTDEIIDTWEEELIYRPGSKKANELKKISSEARKKIDKNLKEKILYFPTYRRIEEELKNLGYGESSIRDIEQDNERLIQFGMNDVVKRFDKIKSDFENSIVNSFSRLSGGMLTQLLEGIPQSEIREDIDPEVLKIVLSRVGDKNISQQYKEKIQLLVENGQIKSKEHRQLAYFLSQLIEVYEEQRDKNESMKNFVEVCNRYLNKKQIIYDESTVNVSITDIKNEKEIDIKYLSSGEKQIISIFSKMYLDYSNDFILLFDEPELSLSIEWQRMLLPDILKSGKCKLLIAATHSPFIFENELDFNAVDLDSYITER